jgi:muramoyltetrapeptide carboxypeptidase LdcA involved in peptidoglycan recycling
MQKPSLLKCGDTIAVVALSEAPAFQFPIVYEWGKEQLEKELQLKLIAAPHALMDDGFLKSHPKLRAADLHWALENPEVKAIIAMTGGSDSIRNLPHIDLNIIRNNPKVFLGNSDTTVMHFCFQKAAVVSFLGPALLTGFAEPGGVHAYLLDSLQKLLFFPTPAGTIAPNIGGRTAEFIPWGQDRQRLLVPRKTKTVPSWRFLGSKSVAQGEIIGGCFEALLMINGTNLWPELENWQGKILALELGDPTSHPSIFEWGMRSFAAQGILDRISGILVGGLMNKWGDDERDLVGKIILKILTERGRDIPLVTEMDFGHVTPFFTLPLGVKGEINSEEQSFSIIEGAVV